MADDVKRKVLLLLGLTLLAVMLIAASLSQLQLRPGLPMPSWDRGSIIVQPVEKDPGIRFEISNLFKGLMAILLVAALFFFAYRTFRDVAWKNLIRSFLLFALSLLIVFTVLAIILNALPTSKLTPDPLEIPTPIPLATAPLGSPPPVLIWLIGIALFVGGVLLIAWILQSRRQHEQVNPFEIEAQKARMAIRSGLDLKSVILECYRQMSLVLQDEQGIQRQDYMTTGEFERLLDERGYPQHPIHQLTRLFDAARYGREQLDETAEREAIDCLEAIIAFSQEETAHEEK